MTAIYPGSSVIRGFTFLEHPRFQSGTINSFIVDAAIAGSSYLTVDHVICGTLQLKQRLFDRFVDARVYSIEAKVSGTCVVASRPIGHTSTVDRRICFGYTR